MGGAGEERRRAPETSLVRRAFDEGWPRVCESVPQRVKREANAYQRCGDVRYGFSDVTCEGCEATRLVAFCCKGRARPVLLKRLEVRLVRAVWRWQRREARRLRMSRPLRGGAVVFTQWFGSSLQVTPHLHALVAEAQWESGGTVVHLPPPSDDDVAGILARVLRQAKKDFVDGQSPWGRRRWERNPTPRGPRTSTKLASSSVCSGRWAWHSRPRRDVAASPLRMASRCTLTLLCMPMTGRASSDWPGTAPGAPWPSRGSSRSLTDEYTPKKGVSFTVTAQQLVRRLVSLVPPAKTHLTSFHGVYAPCLAAPSRQGSAACSIGAEEVLEEGRIPARRSATAAARQATAHA